MSETDFDIKQRYRVLQIRAIYKSGSSKGAKTDIIVSDLEGLKEQMKAMTGASEIKLTFEIVDDKEYAETEEIMI